MGPGAAVRARLRKSLSLPLSLYLRRDAGCVMSCAIAAMAVRPLGDGCVPEDSRGPHCVAVLGLTPGLRSHHVSALSHSSFREVNPPGGYVVKTPGL